jgi:hypothetical protein
LASFIKVRGHTHVSGKAAVRDNGVVGSDADDVEIAVSEGRLLGVEIGQSLLSSDALVVGDGFLQHGFGFVGRAAVGGEQGDSGNGEKQQARNGELSHDSSSLVVFPERTRTRSLRLFSVPYCEGLYDLLEGKDRMISWMPSLADCEESHKGYARIQSQMPTSLADYRPRGGAEETRAEALGPLGDWSLTTTSM